MRRAVRWIQHERTLLRLIRHQCHSGPRVYRGQELRESTPRWKTQSALVTDGRSVAVGAL